MSACSERIFSGAQWDRRGHMCSLAAKVERDGKWYCTKHDPVRVKAKREKEDRKREERRAHERKIREAEAAEKAEQKRRAEAFPDLLEALEAFVASFNAFEITNSSSSDLDHIGRLHVIARAAIAKARGEA